jgi:hypothetical protein
VRDPTWQDSARFVRTRCSESMSAVPFRALHTSHPHKLAARRSRISEAVALAGASPWRGRRAGRISKCEICNAPHGMLKCALVGLEPDNHVRRAPQALARCSPSGPRSPASRPFEHTVPGLRPLEPPEALFREDLRAPATLGLQRTSLPRESLSRGFLLEGKPRSVLP